MIMGVIRAPLWMQRYYRFEPRAGGGKPWSATVLGMAFGFGWTPCIGPVLGGILVLGATSESLGQGILLLGIYRSEEHTSELQSLMRISYAVFCLKKKNQTSKKKYTRYQE